MLIEQALYTYLSTYAGLTALIGTRIYPNTIPQNGTLPAVAYTKVSGYRYHSLGGDTGEASPVYQFSVFGSSYSSVKAVTEKIRDALQNYTGLMGGASGVTVKAVLMMSQSDGYDQDVNEYYDITEYQIFYKE